MYLVGYQILPARLLFESIDAVLSQVTNPASLRGGHVWSIVFRTRSEHALCLSN